MDEQELREQIAAVAADVISYAVTRQGYDPLVVRDALAGLAGELAVLQAVTAGANPAAELSATAKVLMAHGHQRWQASRGGAVAGHA